MRKFLLLNIFSCIGASYFSPIAFNLGQEFAINYVAINNSDINFEDINVNYDLRLLFGDVNGDKNISSNEYKDFDFASLTEDMQEWKDGVFTRGRFKFLIFKPNNTDLYVYFVTDFKLGSNDTLSMYYSDSTEMKEDLSGYNENKKVERVIPINYYLYDNYYFYKGKISNFTGDKTKGETVRVSLSNFIFSRSGVGGGNFAIFSDDKATELLYPVGTDWTEGNFYYFQTNTYEYEAHLAMALGVIQTEDYYPIVSAFYIRSNEAKESTVKEAREITYLFVDFDDDLDLSELISVDVEFNKIKYDYVRYTPYYTFNNHGLLTSSEEYDYVFGDIYAGKYYSQEYGSLENGFSLNGKQTALQDYVESVTTFNLNGETEEHVLSYDEYLLLTNGSGEEEHFSEPPYTGYRYNQPIGHYLNGITNVSVLNDGKPYKKTIQSDYNEGDYTYTQIDNATTYWKHTPYKRDYSFEPIINLSTFQQDLSDEKFALSREFIQNATASLTENNAGFQPNFAVLIDGANSDADCTRSVVTEETITLEKGETMPSSGSEKLSYQYQLKRNVTTCHEVYNAIMVEATTRENNGGLITFNCLGNPAYLKYLSFVGYSAPKLFDLVINDVSNWFDSLLNPFKYIIFGIFALILVIIVVCIIKGIIKLFKNNKKIKVNVKEKSKGRRK